MASLHPSWSAATLGLGWKKGFSMHYSPAQKCRTGNEGCAFQFIDTFSHKNCRNGRCWSDELIYSRNGIHLWKQAKEAKSRKLDPNLVSKSKLESNILSFNFHVHNFSFPVCFLLVLSEAQSKQWKPVNMTARNCAFPASWPNLLKNLSRMVASKYFASAVLDFKPAGVGWRSLVNATGICSAGGTNLLSCRHPHQQAAVVWIQAAGDNNTVNKAS